MATGQDEMIELGEKEATEAVAEKEAAETAAHAALMKDANLEVGPGLVSWCLRVKLLVRFDAQPRHWSAAAYTLPYLDTKVMLCNGLVLLYWLATICMNLSRILCAYTAQPGNSTHTLSASSQRYDA